MCAAYGCIRISLGVYLCCLFITPYSILVVYVFLVYVRYIYSPLRVGYYTTSLSCFFVACGFIFSHPTAARILALARPNSERIDKKESQPFSHTPLFGCDHYKNFSTCLSKES